MTGYEWHARRHTQLPPVLCKGIVCKLDLKQKKNIGIEMYHLKTQL